MLNWQNRPIIVNIYASEDEPGATQIELKGWGALAGSLPDVDEMVGFDLAKRPDEHTCEPKIDKRTGKPDPSKCKHKDGFCWSPVALREPYRLDANVTELTLAVFDLDHVTTSAIESILGQLRALNIAFVCHSTHSHKPPADCAARLIFPVSRPILPKEWERLFDIIPKHYNFPRPDTHCRNASRFYFLPRIPTGAPFFFASNDAGRPLDIDALLRANAPAAKSPAPAIQASNDPPAVEIGSLRSLVVNLRRSKQHNDPEAYALLGRVLTGRFLALPGHSDMTDPDGVSPGRDGAINKVASMLGFAFPAETPSDAAVEMLRPCISKMEIEPEGLDYWLEKARDSYCRAVARKADQEARRAEENAKLRSMLSSILAAKGVREHRDAPASPVATITEDGESDEEIAASLERGEKSTKPKASRVNVEAILLRSRAVRGFVRWNEYAKTVEVTGGMFAGMMQNQIPLEVASWLERSWNLAMPTAAVKEAIELTAYRHVYNPLRNYLKSLQWDGTKRIDNLLLDYVPTRKTDSAGNDITNVLRAFGRKWAISAVARALTPGCQVDTVLVFEGKEGHKKTSFFRVMGGPFFASTAVHVGDKDANLAAGSAWIIELAEMASLKKGENQMQKAFLSQVEDFYRRPYGSAYEKCPRGCVFVGTVNPDDFYLPHNDLNRRYWCVYIEDRIDTAKLEYDRDQLWAEAVAEFVAAHDAAGRIADHTYWLTDDEAHIAQRQAAEKTQSSVMSGRIDKWWHRLSNDQRPREFTIDDIVEKLMLQNDDVNKMRSIITEIGIALNQLGFQKKRGRRPGSPRVVTIYMPGLGMVDEGTIAGEAPSVGAVVRNIAEARKAAL